MATKKGILHAICAHVEPLRQALDLSPRSHPLEDFCVNPKIAQRRSGHIALFFSIMDRSISGLNIEGSPPNCLYRTYKNVIYVFLYHQCLLWKA